MKLSGKIIKILANFYYVQDSKNKVWECFARARLLKEGKLLFVGDEVEIEESNASQGVVVNLCKRKNQILKPPIANVDQILIVFSTTQPEFDFYNLDRYLSFVRYELPNEKTIVCINKIDLKKLDINESYKESSYDVFYVSALTKEGLDKLANQLASKATVLTGPSGVGKSSLIKALAPEYDVKIGSLSSINQGKQITRNVQLVPIDVNGLQGFLADTPGFRQFSFATLNPSKIRSTFNELNNLNCGFSNCLHNGEENCTLEENSDLIPATRLESYRKILNESQSEVLYGTKEETKVKSIGNRMSLKGKVIPKIDYQMRAKSRKKEKQELLKLEDEVENQ